jgi:hypothetical protein
MNSAEVDEVKRHFSIVAEGLSSEIRLVADAVAAVDQKLDREIATLRTEMNEQFEETRAMIRLSYSELDRRLRTLEDRQGDLETRVQRLEAR